MLTTSTIPPQTHSGSEIGPSIKSKADVLLSLIRKQSPFPPVTSCKSISLKCQSANMRLLFILTFLFMVLESVDANVHFQHWYQQYRHKFTEIMQTEQCVNAYQIYLHNQAPSWDKGGTTAPVVDCIMDRLNEATKSNMAAAAVLLGLLPTTLSLLGSTTTEVGLVALRRPFLAFLLAASAPAVSPTRTFDCADPRSPLENRQKIKSVEPLGGPTRRNVVSVFQYLIAFGTIANLVHTSWELCMNTVCSFSLETSYQPALWAFLAVAIHACGTWAVMLRVQIVRNQPSLLNDSIRARVYERFIFEWIPSVEHPKGELKLRQETYLSIFIRWLSGVGTVLHIIFGTLVFSSIMFISTQDAVYVCSRYLASTIVARVVVMYELSAMRAVLDVSEDLGYIVHFSSLSSKY